MSQFQTNCLFSAEVLLAGATGTIIAMITPAKVTSVLVKVENGEKKQLISIMQKG